MQALRRATASPAEYLRQVASVQAEPNDAGMPGRRSCKGHSYGCPSGGRGESPEGNPLWPFPRHQLIRL